MSADDRLDRLEHRLTVLEGLVRQLLAQAPVRRESPTPASGEVGRGGSGEGAQKAGGEVGQRVSADVEERVSARRPRVAVDSEQWFGQRGLLAIGVTFLILAAGYLLKLSFDRGWVSPAARCAGGALAGFAVGAIGYRLHRKGLAIYGAALIGCGAAIVYLAVWAASRLYQFLPPTSGIAGLALISLALAAIAFIINVEALGATAALGAFFAPLLLGTTATDANVLLLYLGLMGICLGWVAARKGWRLAMLVVTASYFGMVMARAWEFVNPHALVLYALIGGCAGLYVGLREGWWETRVLSFSSGWGLLGLADQNLANHWPTLAGGIVLAAPVWWRALSSRGASAAGLSSAGRESPGESFYFYLTPILLAWALYQVAPATFDRSEGLLPLIIALPYLGAGYAAYRPRFALVGTTAVLLAALVQWEGLGAPLALLLASLLWAGMDHLLQRHDGRWYGLLALGSALAHLVYSDAVLRGRADPAFIGNWALLLWAVALVAAFYAARLWRRAEGDDKTIAERVPSALWSGAGLLLLLGVTAELQRYFLQAAMAPEAASLASGLSVSAWWIIFSAGLVILGFRRGVKPVRVAGLVVSGMAVLKVVLVDLSGLDALYRVGSVLILGVVSLGLAYLYHRRGREQNT